MWKLKAKKIKKKDKKMKTRKRRDALEDDDRAAMKTEDLNSRAGEPAAVAPLRDIELEMSLQRAARPAASGSAVDRGASAIEASQVNYI